jgi:tetratricopeptide (TPR) repeat protein
MRIRHRFKKFRIHRLKSPTNNPAQLNDSYYKHLSDREPQIAGAAKEVKDCLARGKTSKGLIVCDQMLALYPGHLLFEGLRLELENKERQTRFEYIKQVCSELNRTPDLDRRVAQLQQAVDRYPHETQLVQLLRNSIAKRDLIKSLLSEARAAELCDNHAESLERLYTIRECDPSMPHLTKEIERLESILRLRTRTKRRSELLENIYSRMSAREYERAFNHCANALAEFPSDPEILVLQKTAEERSHQGAEIQKLIEYGLTCLDAHQVDAALKAFRSAGALDPNDLRISKLIGVALLVKTRTLMSTDPVTANLLLEEAKHLVPNHPDIETLSLYMNRQARNGGELEFPAIVDTPAVEGIHEEVKAELVQQIQPNSLRESFWQTALTAGSLAWKRLDVERRLLNFRASVVDLYASFREFQPSYNSLVVFLSLVGIVVVVGSAYLLLRQRTSSTRPAAARIMATPVQISASPEGAEIAIEGQGSATSVLQTKLNPGNYMVTAKMSGYESQTIPLTLSSIPLTLTISLQPLPLDLHVVTDEPSGRIWMDDEPKGNLSAAGLIISGISPGEHKLRVRSPDGEITTSFDFQPGKLPVPVSLPIRHTPAVLFVGSSDEKSRVQCNCSPAALKVGDSRQSIESGGLELNLAEGSHPAELSVMGGKKLTIYGSRVPVATVALYWGSDDSPTVSSVDALLQEANTMIYNRNYKAALSKVSEVLMKSPGDDRAPILQKRLQRLMAIDP